MLNNKIVLVAITSITALTACQSTPTAPVMARADSTFETTGLGSSKVKAQQNALNSAKKQCGSKTPIILADSSTYHGVIDEKMGRVIEQGVGVVGAIFGTDTPNLTRDDDYEYHIKFRCQ